MKTFQMLSSGLLMLIFLIGNLSMAQSETQIRTISGKVTDQTHLPIQGVTIQNLSTSKITTTDEEGKYSIQAKTKDRLTYSFVGMKPITVTVTEKNTVNIFMEADLTILQDVVVEGYQTVYSRSLSSQVAGLKISGNSRQIPVPIQSTKKNLNHGEFKRIKITDEEYGKWIENPFVSPKMEALSTFSIDVDNASYTNMRRHLNLGQAVPKEAIRIEEMLNFFQYNYAPPTQDDPMAIHTVLTDCPWNEKHQLLKIGLKGKEIPTNQLPSSNLVFLIDVSGSMSEPNKLPLLVQSFKVLVSQLRKQDCVAIVTYAGSAGVILNSTSGEEKEVITTALERLRTGGSTAGSEGIRTAYRIAQENFISGGNNRVILATDGDFNVGIRSDSELEKLIEQERNSGIFLTVLGFGTGNLKDSKMEILANKGNGNYAYIDTFQEANRFLGKEFKGSMYAIAKDVKIQVEFNPKYVRHYRLIGYENRKLRPEDFTDDKIDAGELGSGHSVTALYEIIPVGVKSAFAKKVPALKYSQYPKETQEYPNDLATIRFRYKKPDSDQSRELNHVVDQKRISLSLVDADTKFAAAVAWFGLKLRASELVSNKNLDDILTLAKSGLGSDADGYRSEFLRLTQIPVVTAAN